MRNMRSLLLSSICLLAAPVIADEMDDDLFSLETITCWDFTGIEADARAPALMMLYGYVAGSHDLKDHSAKAIAPALEQVGKLCMANPDMYVVNAIERVMLKPEE